jgi:drug/metabolite transporter (DMT)-like permease
MEGPRGERIATVLLYLAPAMFACNILIARATFDFIPPVALAFWRWAGTLLLLLPMVGAGLWRGRHLLVAEWKDLAVLGALGMGVCGVFVYVAAQTTTATNIGLIYAASPVLIILLSRFIWGEVMSGRQLFGVALALLGVLIIICKADPQVLLDVDFTAGDLWAFSAMVGWAVYSVMLSHRPSAMPVQLRFGAICLFGILILLPFLIWESVMVAVPRLDATTVGAMALLALVPGFGAYQAYGLIQKSLGPSRTGLLIYLLPVYSALLAVLLLGESLKSYHYLGACLVLLGLLLATRKPRAGT